mmetsp:Transcript_108194/g.186771  ORF Transcript_108194/g.186771 Transcript_108194/m.186771 type:complete len:216 (-) Transcript_108194:2058-2705(-)
MRPLRPADVPHGRVHDSRIRLRRGPVRRRRRHGQVRRRHLPPAPDGAHAAHPAGKSHRHGGVHLLRHPLRERDIHCLGHIRRSWGRSTGPGPARVRRRAGLPCPCRGPEECHGARLAAARHEQGQCPGAPRPLQSVRRVPAPVLPRLRRGTDALRACAVRANGNSDPGRAGLRVHLAIRSPPMSLRSTTSVVKSQGCVCAEFRWQEAVGSMYRHL